MYSKQVIKPYAFSNSELPRLYYSTMMASCFYDRSRGLEENSTLTLSSYRVFGAGLLIGRGSQYTERALSKSRSHGSKEAKGSMDFS